MNVRAGFERHIQYSRGVLRTCEDLYHLDSYSRVLIVAFGAYAQEMTALLVEQLGPLATGIISTPHVTNQAQISGFRYFHGGHPLPAAESVRAADAILKSLNALDQRALAIYLISPGSSFVESPIDHEMSLEDLAATYNVLGESQCSPSEAKSILKHLSSVKGGRMTLAAACNGAQQVSIFARDSPEDSLDSVACGPTLPDSSCVEDCYRIATRYKLVERFPPSVRALFERRALEETPEKDHPAFHHCRWWPVTD